MNLIQQFSVTLVFKDNLNIMYFSTNLDQHMSLMNKHLIQVTFTYDGQEKRRRQKKKSQKNNDKKKKQTYKMERRQTYLKKNSRQRN